MKLIKFFITILIALSLFGCIEENEDSNSNSSASSSSVPSPSTLDMTHYESLSVKYLAPGEIRTFTTSSGEDIDISISSVSESSEYDFIITENRPWDSRIRKLGYKSGKIYLLRVRNYDSDRSQVITDFEGQLKNNCINELPVIFSGNTSYFRQEIIIKKNCDNNDIDYETTIKISSTLTNGVLKVRMTSSNDQGNYSSGYESTIDGVNYIYEDDVSATFKSSTSIL